jgi:SAM-dependent methyltransferase
MTDLNDPQYLKAKQYADSRNLDARIRLHQLYSTNDYDFYHWLFDRMLVDFPPDARLLEVGCGHGELWKRNAGRIPSGWEIVLSDFSPGMVAEARQAVAGLSDTAGRQFTVQEFGAQSVPYPDDSFDAVIANMMLYHVPDELAAIAELRRVLKPQGILHAATNGPDHMIELDQLGAAVGLSLSRYYSHKERFGLENGAERLETAFGTVILSRYDCDLKVTDVEPLVDYVLSMRGGEQTTTPETVARLHELIEARIAADGVFHITKDTGLFIARGEV